MKSDLVSFCWGKLALVWGFRQLEPPKALVMEVDLLPTVLGQGAVICLGTRTVMGLEGGDRRTMAVRKISCVCCGGKRVRPLGTTGEGPAGPQSGLATSSRGPARP